MTRYGHDAACKEKIEQVINQYMERKGSAKLVPRDLEKLEVAIKKLEEVAKYGGGRNT